MYEFSKKHRLVKKQDFQSVFDNPTKIKLNYLLILSKPNTLGLARIGIIINKHHLKRAVDRNLVRRIIRESFRLNQEALKGLDIIVLIRSECTPLDKKAIHTSIEKLWQMLIQSSK